MYHNYRWTSKCDGAAGGGVSAVAHPDRSHKVGVAADETVIADLGAELILAVVVAGDGAAAEVAVLAHIAVADVGQVAHGVAAGKVGVLGLHIGTQMHAVVGDSVHPHMGEGADVVVGAQMTAVDLAGVDGGALVHGAVLDQGIGADDASCADDRLAAQDGACQNGGSRGDDNAIVDLDGTALNVHAVGNVKKQDVLAPAFGSVQLLPRRHGSRNGILHEKNLPSHQSARRKRDRKGDRKIVACPPSISAAESFVPTK